MGECAFWCDIIFTKCICVIKNCNRKLLLSTNCTSLTTLGTFIFMFPNILTTYCNLQNKLFCGPSLGMYINISAIVLSLQIPYNCPLFFAFSSPLIIPYNFWYCGFLKNERHCGYDKIRKCWHTVFCIYYILQAVRGQRKRG